MSRNGPVYEIRPSFDFDGRDGRQASPDGTVYQEQVDCHDSNRADCDPALPAPQSWTLDQHMETRAR